MQMRTITEGNFPKSGSHEVYDLLSKVYSKELEEFEINARATGNWNYEKKDKLQNEALLKLYGNIIETYQFPVEQDLPVLVKTDKGFLILKYADVDSGGYDTTEYWHIMYGNEMENFIQGLSKFLNARNGE